MAGYIGPKVSVTQVDGYNRSEADAEFVNDPNDVITVSGSNVGIGTSNPSESLTVIGSSVVGDTTTSYNQLTVNGGHVGDGGNDYGITINSFEPAITFLDRSTGFGSGQIRVQSNGAFHFLSDTTNDGTIGHNDNTTDFVIAKFEPDTHVFYINNGVTEAMRINGSGRIVVASAAPTADGYIKAPVGGSTLGAWASYSDSTSNRLHMRFENPNGVVGSINTSGSATGFNTSSDYRLKTDAQPMTGASSRVQALNPVNFEWIADGTRTDGFLAHEAQAVVPEAVTGTKDAMRDEEYEVTPAVLDDDGNVVTEAVMGTRSVPDYQGIDQSKLVPLLTAALQEALTKINDMETRLAALENNQ